MTNTATPIADAVQASRSADPWDVPVATDRPRPLEDAFAYAADRLDRLEHLINQLDTIVMHAGHVLEPLLTGGTYPQPETNPQRSDDEAPEDRRSTINRRVSGLGLRADNLADAVDYTRQRLEGILAAAEL